jgi:hypothetical protein
LKILSHIVLKADFSRISKDTAGEKGASSAGSSRKLRNHEAAQAASQHPLLVEVITEQSFHLPRVIAVFMVGGEVRFFGFGVTAV